MPTILATWEAEIARIVVQDQPTQIVYKTLSPNHHSKKWTSGMLKRQSTCFASTKLSLYPNPTKKRKKKGQRSKT
jgi:hypothetical protein